MDQNQMMLEYLMSIGALEPERNAITDQQARVQELRKGGAMPGMRSAGAYQVASNPLEFLSSVGNTGLADYGQNKATSMQNQYGAKIQDQLRRMREQMGMAPPAPDGQGGF